MARLILKSITCIKTAEVGQDELYVRFNGTKRTLPDMAEGHTHALNQQFLFSGPSSLSLFEDDGDHWWDGDDFIASHAIATTPGDFALDYASSSGQAIGAHYILNVSVDPSPANAVLRLVSISCLEAAETFGDELYVTFNGTKFALPNMDNGESKDLGHEFVFQGSPTLSLFENDGDHWWDRDDFMGSYTIDRTPGDRTLVFKPLTGDGRPGNYEININVRAG